MRLEDETISSTTTTNRFAPTTAALVAISLCPMLTASNDASADLLGYWAFDDAAGSATALDYSGNANHGTITTATYTADAAGQTGLSGDRAMDFGAYNNNANVEITNAASAFTSITSNNAATISLWINGDVAGPYQTTHFGFYDGSANRQMQSHLPWNNNVIYWDVGGGATNGVNRIFKTENNASKWEGGWNHYVFTKSGTSSKIYQNGALWHSGSTSASLGTIANAFIGSGSGTNQSFAGQIDDFAVWDEELSSGDINAIYTGAKTPGDWASGTKSVILADNPVAYWRMDETSGTTFADSSGNGNNLVSSGSLLLNQPGATADENASADFTGASATASTVTGLRENFSVEFWLNPDSTSNYNQSIGAGGGWGQFRFHTGNNGEVWVGTNSGGLSRIDSGQLGSGTIVDNEWQHIVFTLEQIGATNTGTANFYKDGELLATKVINLGSAWTNLNLAGGIGGSAMDGNIDELAVFDYALTAEQVGAHYASAFVPEPTSLALLGLGGLLIARRRRS